MKRTPRERRPLYTVPTTTTATESSELALVPAPVLARAQAREPERALARVPGQVQALVPGRVLARGPERAQALVLEPSPALRWRREREAAPLPHRT